MSDVKVSRSHIILRNEAHLESGTLLDSCHIIDSSTISNTSRAGQINWGLGSILYFLHGLDDMTKLPIDRYEGKVFIMIHFRKRSIWSCERTHNESLKFDLNRPFSFSTLPYSVQKSPYSGF